LLRGARPAPGRNRDERHEREEHGDAPDHRVGAPVSSSSAIVSRIFSSERRIRRETCICEIPTCCAICDCVKPSKKRSCRILRSRSSRALKPGASTARSSETSYWCSVSRSEEHTSELQSRGHLVCRLLLEKKK